MGGAQPLAVTMNDGHCLAVEVDPWRIQRRVETGYCDVKSESLDEALGLLENARGGLSVALLGNIAEILPEMVRRGIVPDVITDQTSAHDLRHGYIPAGYSLDEAGDLRAANPEKYDNEVLDSMVAHVQAILDLQKQGSVCFDYGNNLRGQVADNRSMPEAFNYPGFVPAYIRPLFCKGAGPFRWAAARMLSGCS
jgi:urocanate hydratase